MNYKNVLKEEVDQIISQSNWGRAGISLTESTEAAAAPAKAQEEAAEEQVVESEDHSCPLCESALEAPISDEQLTEHIEMMLGIINEMNDISDEELDSIAEEFETSEDESSEDSEVVAEASYGKGKGKKPLPPFMKGARAKKAEGETPAEKANKS